MTDQTPRIGACTVCRDIERYECLIDEMDKVMGEAWGDLPFRHLPRYLEQPQAQDLRFLTFAIDAADDIEEVAATAQSAKQHGIKVILVTRDLSTEDLHYILRHGGDEFIPYPPPENALAEAVERLFAPEDALPATLAPTPEGAQESAAQIPEPSQAVAPPTPPTGATPVAPQNAPAVHISNDHQGAVFAVQGLSGGSGASTLAINLAVELARLDAKKPRKVCLLDFDLQFGAAASLLDLPQNPAVLELLSDTESMDLSSFSQALQKVQESLFVLTAPEDLIPLDFVNGEDISRLIAAAQQSHDYVIVDMPRTIVDWTATVLRHSHIYFATLESDLRSAQNCVRFRNALSIEGLPSEKLRFVLNRAPKRTDLNGRSRTRRLCESLEISLEIQLPDGGKAITQAADQGEPLAQTQPKNPLRREILKLAQSIHARAGAEG